MPPPLSDTPQESPGAPASRSTATDRVPDVDTPKVRAAVVPPSGNQEPEPLESPPVPVAPEPEPAASHSPERIEAFLASYCGAYQALNYDRFMGYFTPDAVENDQAVKDLEASYRHNFETLRDLAYRIDVDHVTVQGDRVDVTGDYVLRWRFRNTGWRKREGPIFLSLVQGDENYQVKRLVYR
jgi:ketosteroid isomerase-like protein